MIRKLRIRFIAAAMLATFLVLAVMIGAINLINYHKVIQDADALLETLAEGGGRFPDHAVKDGMRPGMMEEVMPDDMDEPGGTDGPPQFNESGMNGEPPQFETGGMNGPRNEGKGFNGLLKNGGNPLLSAETPYETRFFTITLDSKGSVTGSDTGFIAAISEEEAIAYAQQAYSSGKTKGFLDSYRYLKAESGSSILMIFLDCSRTLGNAGTFLIISIGMALLGLALVFVLVLLFSKPIFEPVAESYRKQKQFITDASHELKTPLTIIDANTEVIEMLEGESEWTQSIRGQVQRLSGLTNDLVTLARLDENLQPDLADFNLSEAVNETAESFKAGALTREIDFSMKLAPGLVYKGDEKKIRQLISILLDNALKYCTEKGTIRVTLNRSGKNTILSVYNTADHVDPASLPKLFERFYRADASRNSATGGYGIGLSIARAIVDLHKGRITATTKSEKDLTITVVL